MNSLRIRTPISRSNSVSSYSPSTTPKTFVPLMNVEAKERVSVSDLIETKNQAKNYFKQFCNAKTLGKVKSLYPTNTAIGSYYQKACDKARLASFRNITEPIPASPSWAKNIKNEALTSGVSAVTTLVPSGVSAGPTLVPSGVSAGPTLVPAVVPSAAPAAGGKRKTRKSRKSRKSRRNRRSTRRT